MKTQKGFTLIEKISEIKTYLDKQAVTRKITRLHKLLYMEKDR